MSARLLTLLVVVLLMSSYVLNIVRADNTQFDKDFSTCADFFNIYNDLPNGFEYSYDMVSQTIPNGKIDDINNNDGGIYRLILEKDARGTISIYHRLFFYVHMHKLADNKDTDKSVIKVQCDLRSVDDVRVNMYYNDKWHNWINSKDFKNTNSSSKSKK